MRSTLIASLVVAGLVLAACGSGSDNVDTLEGSARASADPTPETASTALPTTVTEPDYSTAQQTLDTWAAAIGDTDIDAAMATHRTQPEQLMSDREAMSYIAVTVSSAEFEGCQFMTIPSNDRIVAQCDLTFIDPILVATQRETVPVSWQLTGDGTEILVSEPGFRLSPKPVFVPYAKEHYPDTFAAACGQDTVNYNALVGWAFNRACGDFTAEIADEVAEVISEAA